MVTSFKFGERRWIIPHITHLCSCHHPHPVTAAMADASFDGVYNFRDVGAAINMLRVNPPSATVPSPALQEKMLYRSGRLDNASEADRRKLQAPIPEGYNLQTVVDLRTKSEHIKQQTTATPTQSSWETVYIDFVGRRFELNMLKQLRWYRIIQFLFLMLIGHRMAAIRILGRNVLGPKGLVGLSRDSLRFCQSEICAALDVVISPTHAHPVLIHCTQGKDRSGLVVMLILFVLGVPLPLVKTEYAMSEEGLAPVRASMIVEVEEIGMDEAYTRAPEEVAQFVWDCLEAEYGGVDAYLDLVGFGEEKRQILRKIMLS
ncbi:Tyrosine serine protein [Mycena kentingensis (nom. inval.)]|nr:Tyrosine serine protein [Mycena kentingensis (nom. inval.)]